VLKRKKSKVLHVMGSLAALTLVLGACSSDHGAHEGAHEGAHGDIDMSQISGDANAADVMFAQMMIPHHEQAVVMSDLAVTRAQDPQLLALAEEIKGAQAPEIELMQSWLQTWGFDRISGDEAMAAHGDHGMAGMLTDQQLQELADAQGAEFDRLFAEYMIEHHRGAILMAQDVLLDGADPAVAALAREIIVTQEREILQLQAFLSGESASAFVGISPPLSHVHGVVVDGEDLLVGSHDGAHRVNALTGKSTRIGQSRDDLMAFSGNPATVLVASGHPGPGSSMRNPLGLVVSSDGGANWQSISLEGEVDFHGIAVRDSELVGWDTRGPLQWSVDGGQTWREGPRLTHTSLAWFGDQVWLATPDQGLVTWIPGQPALDVTGVPGVLLASSSDGSTLWRIDPDGSVHRTVDGSVWTPQGRFTRVEAFAASPTQAFAVTGTSIQVVSTQS
jgi:uncharacterized protein (DUF305 family)